MRSLAPFLLACALSAQAQPGGIPSRETLHYNVEWRLITAGKARLQWSAAPAPRPGWQLQIHLESTGLVSKLFKVQNDYSARLDASLCAESSVLVSHEARRHRDTRVTFEGGKARYRERDLEKNVDLPLHEIDVPACVHDVAGGLYFLRTLSLEPGRSAQVPVSDGKKSVMARIEAQQREDIKTPAGTFKTIRHEVFLFNNVLYRRPANLYVWLTDDSRRLPVQIRVRMQFTIGTITLQLEKVE